MHNINPMKFKGLAFARIGILICKGFDERILILTEKLSLP